ncbi:hypothetical protein [Mycobacterium antarcticum]|nr:hypothetical protein [Mycolicibacterium sp. TUM20985]
MSVAELFLDLRSARLFLGSPIDIAKINQGRVPGRAWEVAR